MRYVDQAGRPSPVHEDVRCFASCVERSCYRSCHPETLGDGVRAIGRFAVWVRGGLIVEAYGRQNDESWRAAQ